MRLDLTKEEIATIKFSIKKSYNDIIKSPRLNEEGEKVLANLTKVHMKLRGLKTV